MNPVVPSRHIVPKLPAGSITMTTLGIDIGGTAVKAIVLSTDAAPLIGISEAYSRPDRTALVRAVHQAVSQVSPVTPTGVGLCVPGRLASDAQSIELSVNVPGLTGYTFESLIRDALGRSYPHVVLSDAEAATLDLAAEHPPATRILGIAMGTGVGAALVENGRSLKLGTHSVGHLGQIDLGPVGSHPVPIGPDGGRGSVEGYLGAPALRARLGPDLDYTLANLPPDDPALLAIARLIRVAIAIYTPDVVVLVGGIALGLRSRASEIERLTRHELTSVAPAGWILEFGHSRHHAARGAARAAKALA